MKGITQYGTKAFQNLPPICLPIDAAQNLSFVKGMVYEHEDGRLVEATATFVDTLAADCYVLDRHTMERGDIIPVWESELVKIVGMRVIQ